MNGFLDIDVKSLLATPTGDSFIQINSIRRLFLENLSVVLFALAVVGLPLSLFRIRQTGVHFIHITHLGITIAIMAVYLFRKRISDRVLISTTILILTTLSLAAFLQYGMVSAGFYFASVCILSTGLALGFWGGIICAGFYLAAICLVAYLWMSGSISFPGDVREYVLLPTVWASLGVTIIITTIVLFMSAKGIISGIKKQMDTINIQKKELEERSAQLTRKNQELKEALAKVNALSGLLPICSNCKKIRDDKGYWQQVERYVRDHTQAEFTHGLCPDCLRKLNPEMAERILKKINGDESR